jgi:hypothetical protein
LFSAKYSTSFSETAVTYLNKCVPICSSGYHNDSITGACVANGGTQKTPVNLQTQPVTDANIKNTLTSSFQNLSSNGVDLAELSHELGLPTTINSDSIDFVNVVMIYDENNTNDTAIVANFKSNSNSNNISYAYGMYYNSSTLYEPTIIKTSKDQYLKYYDLTTDSILTVNNYSSSKFIFSIGSGLYEVRKPSCGQLTADCLDNLYTKHGWLSVWTALQTMVLPETGFALAASCALHNCTNLYSY